MLPRFAPSALVLGRRVGAAFVLCCAVLGAPFLGVADPAPASTNAPASTPAGDAQTIKDEELGLALGVPRGWKVQAFPHSRFPMAFGPQVDGVTPNINLNTEQSDVGDFVKYVDGNQGGLLRDIKECKILLREDFVTTSGLKGIKVTTESTQFNMLLRQLFYFFAAQDRKYVIITATAPSSSIDKLEPQFDEAVRTLTMVKALERK
ncbi:hypothetical protein DB346_11750 [Verrucomicrobia bacterium LW23]|nr:hypothetical protein DB346_11750 [Verrucomicrobia bacterium LW23]